MNRKFVGVVAMFMVVCGTMFNVGGATGASQKKGGAKEVELSDECPDREPEKDPPKSNPNESDGDLPPTPPRKKSPRPSNPKSEATA